MKKLFILLIALFLGGVSESTAQWNFNGNNIYNTNTGFVGIGTDSPSTLFHVSRNITEPTITVQNRGGFGGATFSMIDDASGANWKFKATLSGGFKIRDHQKSLDVFVIEQNSAANLLYLKSGGNIGVGTSAPTSSALVDMTSSSKGFLPPRMTHAELLAIQNPVDGLMVFCADCGSSSSGAMAMFADGAWHSLMFNDCLSRTASPVEGIHESSTTQIIWKWEHSSNAVGYKWNTVNNYFSAEDLDTATTMTEAGLESNTPYIRYAWAYNECGNSIPTILTATTAMEGSACGDSVTIIHIAGNIAPVSKTVKYGTVTNIPGEPSKCWITKNLGADRQATSVSDNSETAAGWYWQFNRKQGYMHDGSTRTPNTVWQNDTIEYTNWVLANDPCAYEIGTGWRVPSATEWINVDAAGGWVSWSYPFASSLKMHAAGKLDYSTGNLQERGFKGSYWSSTQYGIINWARMLFFSGSNCAVSQYDKAYGYSIRCIRN